MIGYIHKNGGGGGDKFINYEQISIMCEQNGKPRQNHATNRMNIREPNVRLLNQSAKFM